jgi:hypothetical protein
VTIGEEGSVTPVARVGWYTCVTEAARPSGRSTCLREGPMGMHVEYVGFTTGNSAREYRLRTQEGGVSRDFVLAISLEAFVARRARFQDAPEICFLKLPDAYLTITDSELEEYRASHSPKPPRRRPKPTPQP